jgi:hypothetical protein
MGLSKTVTTILTGKTAAASDETAIADCTELDLSAAVQIELEANVVYNASGTDAAIVRVWGASSTGDYGDEPIDTFIMPFTAGSTIQHSFQTRASPKYMKVTVSNPDSSYSITGISIISTVQNVT